jgi:hypothetical protein
LDRPGHPEQARFVQRLDRFVRQAAELLGGDGVRAEERDERLGSPDELVGCRRRHLLLDLHRTRPPSTTLGHALSMAICRAMTARRPYRAAALPK